MANQSQPAVENGNTSDAAPVSSNLDMLPGTEHTRPQQRTLEVDTDPKAVIPQFWNPPGMEVERELYPIDITEKGELILKREPPVHDTVAELINRIWVEVPGGFENLCADSEALKKILNKEESKDSSIDIEENDKEKEKEKEDSDAPSVEDEYSENKFQEMRMNLCTRLWEAQNEAANVLGLMNGLISNQLINPGLDANSNSQKPDEDPLKAPIPPEMLHFTFANPPKMSVKRRIRDIKLMVASKRHQLSNSAELLRQRTTRVREANNFEKVFFSRLFLLRSLNWVIQSPTPPLSYKGPRTFLVNYGFSDAGSRYFQRPYAQIIRSEDVTGGIIVEPHSNHQSRKVVFLQIIDKADSGNMADSTCEDSEIPSNILKKFLLPLEPVSSELSIDSDTLRVHQQLQMAQNTALEVELFFQLTQEARALDGILNLEEDSFSIKIDDNRQLDVQLLTLGENFQTSSIEDDQDTTELSGDLAFCRDLKLLLMAKLRLLHQNHMKQRRKKLIHHLPLPAILKNEANSKSPDLSVLRAGIDVIRYHFFRQLIWDITQKVITLVSNSSGTEPRIEAEMLPLPGMFVGMFHSSHLLHIVVDEGHSLHFRLGSPRRIHALLPHGILPLDRETDAFPNILETELRGRFALRTIN